MLLLVIALDILLYFLVSFAVHACCHGYLLCIFFFFCAKIKSNRFKSEIQHSVVLMFTVFQ